MARVFISSRVDDRSVADQLRVALEAQGHRVTSANDADPDSGWYRKVELELDASDAAVVIVGPEISPWQESEIQQILEKSWRAPSTKVVPVMLGPQQVPSALRDFQAVVVEPSSSDWTADVTRAIETSTARTVLYPKQADKRKLATRNSALKSWVDEQRKFRGTRE